MPPGGSRWPFASGTGAAGICSCRTGAVPRARLRAAHPRPAPVCAAARSRRASISRWPRGATMARCPRRRLSPSCAQRRPSTSTMSGTVKAPAQKITTAPATNGLTGPALPSARAARVTAPWAGRPGRALTARRVSQGAFFLVSWLRAHPRFRPQSARPAGLIGAEAIRTGVRSVCSCTLLLYDIPKLWDQEFDFIALSWGGAMGIRTPRPLACHQQASHPPMCPAAGHRPAASMRDPPDPHMLRYFPAVLPGASYQRPRMPCGRPAERQTA